MKPKQTKIPKVTSKVAQEAWACVIMSVAAISEIEAQYENKKVILGFQDMTGMIDFLHLTDLIIAGAEEGKHRALKN